MTSQDKWFIGGTILSILGVGLTWLASYIYSEHIDAGWMQFPYFLTVLAVFVVLGLAIFACFNNARR